MTATLEAARRKLRNYQPVEVPFESGMIAAAVSVILHDGDEGLEALFMIELSKHQRGTVDQFMDDIAGVPEVRVAFLVTGRYDVVVHVVVRDTQHLKDLALDQFTSRPGVTRIETSIIYEARRRYQLPVFQMED